MSFFQKVRAAFGLGTGAENPIDTLDGVLLEETIAIHELNMAKAEFDEICEDLDLKKKACAVLIEKGNPDGEFNKRMVDSRIESVTNDFLGAYKSIQDRIKEISERKLVLEVDVVEKATEFVTMLEPAKQAHLADIISEWQETGEIEGEEIDSQVMAIVKAVDVISDGFFQKGVAAQVGEVRTWSGRKYEKTSNGWVELRSGREKKEKESGKDRKKKQEQEKKHSTQEIVAHAENTSTEQLKKVAADESKDPHIRDAAKREIERRNAEKDKEKRQWNREDKVRAEDREHEAKQKASEKREKKAEEKKAAEAPVAEAKATDKSVVKKKKPQPVKYAPSDSLSAEHSKIEKSFGKYLNSKYKEAKAKYTDKFGIVLNTDNARELSEDYNKNKAELSAAVHEPASAFIKKLYQEMLADKVPKGKSNIVYFTGGGTGAGKSTSLMGAEKKYYDKSNVVYDTNMNGLESAVKKIDQALSAGRKVRVNYTFRDPVDAFKNGAVPRSLRVGRTVPIEEHIRTHLGSMSAILGLKDKYKGNKNVSIVVTDNSRGMGNATRVPISFVQEQEKKYIASELREKLHSINNKLYEQGKIPEGHWKGFRG